MRPEAGQVPFPTKFQVSSDFRLAAHCRFSRGIGVSMSRLEMAPRISIQLSRRPRGFTLVEALVSIVVLALVASAGAVAVGLASATQQEAQLAQLAGMAAQQQVDFLLEQPYDDMAALAGTEEPGHMAAPPAAGAVNRPNLLGGAWSVLGRRTTFTSEPFTFTQYSGLTVEGTRIEVEVFGPDGTVYATIRRHRSKEQQT